MKRYNQQSEFDYDLQKFKNVVLTAQESATSFQNIISRMNKEKKKGRTRTFFTRSMATFATAFTLLIVGTILFNMLKSPLEDQAQSIENSQGSTGDNDASITFDDIGQCAESSDKDSTNSIKVYFHCSQLEEFPLKPVLRDMDVEKTVEEKIEYALQQLMKGPSSQESEAGFISIFNEETANALGSVELQDSGHLIIDFVSFIPNGNTSAGSNQLMNALNYTVSQFEEVKTIEYQYNQSCQDFFDWLQVGVCINYEADDYRPGKLEEQPSY